MSDILYSIECSIDPAKIGKAYPQTDGMGGNYNLHGPNSVWNILDYSEINFIPNLNYFIIDKSAILTDFVSTALIASAGFLVNNRVRKLLDSYSIKNHVYYDATIKFKNSLLNNYSWLHFTSSDDDLIDFEKSSFILTEPLPFFRTQVIEICEKSKSEIFEIRKREHTLALFPNQLVFTSNSKQDFYSFSFLRQKHYITENIFSSIMTEEISGVDIYRHNFSSR
ncbi:MAG: hypothetical protein WBP58_10750 [Chitinophagaceae bacterium]